MYCSNCGKECALMRYDDSFSHEFGIEERWHFGSACCDADVYKEKCEFCNDGEIIRYTFNGDEKLEICEDCGGVGYLELIDLFGIAADDLVDWDSLAKDNRDYDRYITEISEGDC